MRGPKGRPARPRALSGSRAGLPDDEANGARMGLLSRRGFLKGSGAALALSFVNFDFRAPEAAASASGSCAGFVKNVKKNMLRLQK